MTFSEPETVETKLSCRDFKEMLHCLQCSIYFVQKLTASNVLGIYTRRRTCQLTLPRQFVREHGNRIRKSVVLLSGLSHGPWNLWLSICPSRPVMPEVTFSSGWRAFVAFNGLEEGDHLIFSLTAVSQFQVYIFNGNGHQKKPQMLEASVKWSDGIEFPQKKILNQSLGYNLAEGNAGLVCNVCPICARRRPLSEKEFAGTASTDTCSQSSPHSSALNAQVSLEFSQKCRKYFPSFSKRIVARDVFRLEIPQHFAVKYGSQLLDSIQLQGIHESSPVRNLQTISHLDKARVRLYLAGAGWDNFVTENMLRVGNELVFYLSADSFFKVVDSTVAYDSMFEKPAHSFKFVDILPRNEEMDLKGGNMKERMGNPHSATKEGTGTTETPQISTDESSVRRFGDPMTGKKREKSSSGLHNLFLFFLCKRYKHGTAEALVKEIDIEVADLNYISPRNSTSCESHFYGPVTQPCILTLCAKLGYVCLELLRSKFVDGHLARIRVRIRFSNSHPQCKLMQRILQKSPLQSCCSTEIYSERHHARECSGEASQRKPLTSDPSFLKLLTLTRINHLVGSCKKSSFWNHSSGFGVEPRRSQFGAGKWPQASLLPATWRGSP
uniref:TF-B3 domain-containing protein n=1 Tax=Physcomitrium patens TaxID=3218 RepID=A0A7I4CZY7_PHYPA